MKITGKEIGNELKSIRIEHHFTLRQVETLYGRDNTTISKWETGDINIPAIELINYLDFYGVRIDDFFYSNL